MLPVRARNVVFIVHYFPPVNSTGGKRVEALSKYFVRAGRSVTVVTTVKTGTDGAFSELAPEGVRVLEINRLGRIARSIAPVHQVLPASAPPRRRLRQVVQRWCGQLPDPRLPFSLAFCSPFLASEVKTALKHADVVISSMPPWPTHLAALIVHWRFRKPVVMDYRDNFSRNHIMPGSALAKFVEEKVDRWLVCRASGVVVISEPMAEYYRQFSSRVKVILNGYDGEIFDQVRALRRTSHGCATDATTVRYMGRISKDRIPRALLAALTEMVTSGRIRPQSMHFEFYGDAGQLRDYVSRLPGPVQGMFRFFAPVPYRQAIDLMFGADYLLFAETSDQTNLSAKGVLTTKLFEYLATQRPILAEIDPDTEAGRLMRRAGRGHVIGSSKEDFITFLDGGLGCPSVAASDPIVIRSLSRESQADDYLAFLDSEVCRPDHP